MNTTDTDTDDWWVNAAVASCRPNLNTRCHVCVLCMHKVQTSVHVMLKCFPQTHQASSMLVPCISFIFQITTYRPIKYHSTSTDRSSYQNTSSRQHCLEACWTQTLSLKFGMNYKTVITDNLKRCRTIFHTL